MLKEQIKKDFKEAFKNQKKDKISVLRMLKADITKKEQNKRYQIAQEKEDLSEEQLKEESALTDEEVLGVITSKIKKSKESIKEFEKGDRKDLIEKEKKEIEILEKYLPEQLSEEELEKIIKETVKEVGAEEMKDMSKVMSKLMPKVKGKAEGSVVAEKVKSILS